MGGSSGLIAHVALQVAREVDDPDACVVMVLCDTGERYLSKLYNDEWMRENQMLDTERTPLAVLLAARQGDIPELVSIAPGTSVRQALTLMHLHDVSQLPVMEGDDCVGSVSESALSVRALENTKLLETLLYITARKSSNAQLTFQNVADYTDDVPTEVQVYQNAIDHGVPYFGPSDLDISAGMEYFTAAMEAALSRSKTPQQALDDFVREANRAVFGN